jgi:hypothetical protein
VEVSFEDLQNVSKTIVDTFSSAHALPKDYFSEFRQFLIEQLGKTLDRAGALNKQNRPEGFKGILKLQENLLSSASFERMASNDKVMIELLKDINNNTKQTADNTEQLVAEERGAKYLEKILDNLSFEKDFFIQTQKALLSNA